MRDLLIGFLYKLMRNKSISNFVERLNGIREKQMLAELLSDLHVTCVVDAGANRGQYSRMLRRLGYRGKIISFEPNPAVFQMMVSTMSKDPNWKGVNCGLGSADGELEMNIFDDSLISSFLPGGQILSSKVDQVLRVPVKRLDGILPDLLEDLAQQRIYLKCDTQGFDLHVVQGAEGVMGQIAGMQSELAVKTLYVGMPRYLEALALYESLGFELMDFWLVNRTVTGEALEYDGILRKKNALNGPKR